MFRALFNGSHGRTEQQQQQQRQQHQNLLSLLSISLVYFLLACVSGLPKGLGERRF